MQRNVVIAGYARSPFHFASKGELARCARTSWRRRSCAACSRRPASIRAEVEDLILGCAFPEGEQGFNVARWSACWPTCRTASPAQTINRFCGSSMQAIHSAAGAIADGRRRGLHLRRRREHDAACR